MATLSAFLPGLIPLICDFAAFVGFNTLLKFSKMPVGVNPHIITLAPPSF